MTSVRFTTDGKEPAVAVVFRACVTGMSREGGSDNGWNIEGYLFDHPNVAGFKGCYNGKTREGLLILALR